MFITPLTKTFICLKYGVDNRLGTVCNIYLCSIIPKMSFSFFCNLLNPKQQPQTLDLPLSLCLFFRLFNMFRYKFFKTKALKFFEICTGMRFGSIFFLNERNITTTVLMIHLKWTVVHYTNLNSSSINKLF